MSTLSFTDDNWLDKLTNVAMGKMHQKRRRVVLKSHMRVFGKLTKDSSKRDVIKAIIERFIKRCKTSGYTLSPSYITSLAKTAQSRYNVKAHEIIAAINNVRKILEGKSSDRTFFTDDSTFKVSDTPIIKVRKHDSSDKSYSSTEICLLQRFFTEFLNNEFKRETHTQVPNVMTQLAMVVLLSIDSCARNTQILHLTVSQMKDLELSLECEARSKCGYGVDYIQITQSTAPLVSKYLDTFFPWATPETCVFTTTYNQLYKLFIARYCEIFNEPYSGKSIFHGIRTFKLHDLAKIDLRLAQNFANHKSIKTTNHYVTNQQKFNLKDVKREMKTR